MATSKVVKSITALVLVLMAGCSDSGHAPDYRFKAFRNPGNSDEVRWDDLGYFSGVTMRTMEDGTRCVIVRSSRYESGSIAVSCDWGRP